MRRPFLAWYLAGMGLVAATIVPNQWVQVHWGVRFMFSAVAALVGLLYLVALVLPERRVATTRRRPPPGRPATPARDRQARRRASGQAGRGGRGPTPKKATATRDDPAPATTEAAVTAATAETRRRRDLRLAASFAAAFGAWSVISALASGHAAISLAGQYVPATGAVFTLGFLGMWAAGICAGRDASELVEWALLAALGLNALFAILQTVTDMSGLELGTFSGRAPGLFADPVYLAPFAVGGFWLVVHKYHRDPIRWGAAAVVAAATIEVSGSRFALGLLVVAALLAFAVVGLRLGAILAGLVVVGLLAGAGLAHVGGPAITTSTSRAVEDTGTGLRPRFETWKQAPKEVARKPIFGYGPDQFRAASGPDRTLAMANSEGTDRMFPDAHNIIVEYAVTLGLPGVALFLGFIFFALRLIRWRTPLAGFGALGLAMHLVEPRHVTATPLVFLALGVAAAGSRPRAPALPDPAPAAAGFAAVVIGFVPAIGTAHLDHRSHDFATFQKDHKTARSLLGIWATPWVFSATGNVNAARANRSQAPALFQEARGWLVTATHREPDDPANWTLLGEVDQALGRTTDAESEFRRALKDNPWSVDTMQALGRLLQNQGRQAEVAQIAARLKLVKSSLAPATGPAASSSSAGG